MLKLCTFCVQTKSKNSVGMSEPWGYGKDNGKLKIFWKKYFSKDKTRHLFV